MKLVQSNFMNMVKAVCDLFTSYPDLWKNKPLITKVIEKLMSLLVRIRTESVAQEQNKTAGYTAEKDRQRSILEDRLLQLADRLKVYAQENDYEVGVKQMSISRTSLSRMSLNSLITKAKAIVQITLTQQSIPEEYEITKKDIDEITAMITATEDMSAHRDAVQGERSGNTASLKILFDELRKEIHKLDIRVKAYIDDAEFVNTYTFTRRIRDSRGGGPRKKEDQKPVSQ